MNMPESVTKAADAGKETRIIVRLPAMSVVRGLYFEEYLRLRRDPANAHLRMTYHDGTLELMSPEYVHEGPSRRLGLLIAILAEELDVTCEGTQSTTFSRGEKGVKKGKGKEPDQSFYFANAGKILGLKRINLDRDPPPDLWIEVDNRSSSQGRLPLYAALGVPEVWRYRARSRKIWFGRLGAGGAYEPIERSLNLPLLTTSLVEQAVDLGSGVPESTWVRRVRAWVRETIVPNR